MEKSCARRMAYLLQSSRPASKLLDTISITYLIEAGAHTVWLHEDPTPLTKLTSQQPAEPCHYFVRIMLSSASSRST